MRLTSYPNPVRANDKCVVIAMFSGVGEKLTLSPSSQPHGTSMVKRPQQAEQTSTCESIKTAPTNVQRTAREVLKLRGRSAAPPYWRPKLGGGRLMHPRPLIFPWLAPGPCGSGSQEDPSLPSAYSTSCARRGIKTYHRKERSTRVTNAAGEPFTCQLHSQGTRRYHGHINLDFYPLIQFNRKGIHLTHSTCSATVLSACLPSRVTLARCSLLSRAALPLRISLKVSSNSGRFNHR